MSTDPIPSIESGGSSETGPVREDNQDCIRVADISSDEIENGYLFAVADGMGGYANGGMASNIALQALFDTFYSDLTASPQTVLQRAMDAANLRVYQAAQRLGVGRMGTTLTAVAILGHHLFLGHVGDSRAYLIRDGQAICLTQDHTAVGDLVRLKVIAPERVRTHAQRSILNRAIGLGLFVQPDLTSLPLRVGDRLVLCSDGLWSVVEDAELAQLAVQAASANELSQLLVERAVYNGSDDNISAVTVFINAFAGIPARAQKQKRGLFDALRGLFVSGQKHTSA